MANSSNNRVVNSNMTSARRWGWPGMLLLTIGGLLPPACIGERPGSCSTQSDCATGQFCGGSGFCETECRQDFDCPCGSKCALGCGICLRDDGLGPATCFPFQRGIGTDEVLGACRNRAAGSGNAGSLDASENTSAEGGEGNSIPRNCPLKLATIPSCVLSPPAQPLPDAGPIMDAAGGAPVDMDASSAGTGGTPSGGAPDTGGSNAGGTSGTGGAGGVQ
jgi:hypothetical protein